MKAVKTIITKKIIFTRCSEVTYRREKAEKRTFSFQPSDSIGGMPRQAAVVIFSDPPQVI